MINQEQSLISGPTNLRCKYSIRASLQPSDPMSHRLSLNPARARILVLDDIIFLRPLNFVPTLPHVQESSLEEELVSHFIHIINAYQSSVHPISLIRTRNHTHINDYSFPSTPLPHSSHPPQTQLYGRNNRSSYNPPSQTTHPAYHYSQYSDKRSSS